VFLEYRKWIKSRNSMCYTPSLCVPRIPKMDKVQKFRVLYTILRTFQKLMITVLLLVRNSVIFRDVWAGALMWRSSNVAHVHISCQDLMANSITDPNAVCDLMDCLVMVFVDVFSNCLNIFCHFAGVWLPWTLSSWADTWLALKRECHSKTSVRLKECSLKASRSVLKVFGSGFTELHAKLDADTFDFAIHHRQKETQSRKGTCVVCSQHGVMWQSDAIGFQKCDLGLPYHPLSPRQLQQ
jgi:hypothetical protein